jgi:hypothetical protein
MSNFLNDEDFKVIQKMMESKGLPKFHLIAFNTEDLDVPRYQMASGFASYKDLFTLREIYRNIVIPQIETMCSIIEKGETETQEDNMDIEVVGKPTGTC